MKKHMGKTRQIFSRTALKSIRGKGSDCADECGPSTPCPTGKTCTPVDERGNSCARIVYRCF